MRKKKERELVKSMFGGCCAYCGHKLLDKWHVDHVKPVFRDKGVMSYPENDTIDNKFPSCAKCNNFKVTFSIEEFRSEIAAQVERARKYSVNFRTAERFGLIEVKQNNVIFWFEKFNGEGK